MVTIAFGFMAEVTSNRWSLTGGPMGIMSIPAPTLARRQRDDGDAVFLADRRRRADLPPAGRQPVSLPHRTHAPGAAGQRDRRAVGRRQRIPLQGAGLRYQLGLRRDRRRVLRPSERLHQQRYLRLLAVGLVSDIGADGRKRHAVRATGRQRHSQPDPDGVRPPAASISSTSTAASSW